MTASATESWDLEAHIHSNDTLVLWQDPKERMAVFRILAATGAKVFQATSLAAAPAKPYRLVVLDGASTGGQFVEILTQLAAVVPPPVVLVVTDDRDQSELLELFSNDMLSNLLAKNTALKAHELVVTAQKLLRNDIFGIEKYLTWGAHLHRETIRSSERKGTLLDELESYLRALGCNQRLLELARGVADELIMNAVYDAPSDAEGKSKYSSRSRTQRVDLEANEEVTFCYACDGRSFAVSVSDNFGRLERSTVLGYLRKCMSMGADQIDDKPGGAGLGLYYVFESVNSLVINLAKNRRTEMIGLMDVSGTYRDFADKPKSLHLFMEANSG